MMMIIFLLLYGFMKDSKNSNSGNTHRFTQNNTKNYQIGKCQPMMEYIHSCSRNVPPFTTDEHKEWTDAYKEHTYSNEWPKERPDHIDPEGPSQVNRPKQLHNLPTDNAENINSTNKGRDLLFAKKLGIVPWWNREDAA